MSTDASRAPGDLDPAGTVGDDRVRDDAGHEDPLDTAADLFDRFLDDLLDGRPVDPDAVLAAQPELRDQVFDALELAHSVVPGRPLRAPPVEFGGYRILRELGRGGMGTVYLARQESLGREVALKVLPPGVALSEHARRRFVDEARALAKVRDDHIVQIHDVLVEGDTLAYAMEWIDGRSLKELVDELRALGRPATLGDLADMLGGKESELDARSALDYLVSVAIAMARALGKVHAAGLLHRDVKPANILLRRDGQPLLADFGLVRDSDSTVTRTGRFVGTPAYAAPEQLRGGAGSDLDARADVYSLAVTLFEAVALQLPYAADSTTELLQRIDSGSGAWLRKLVPRLPRDLETILHKAMQPRAADRYSSAAELADDLERLLRFEPIRARRPRLLQRGARFARRYRTVLAAGVLGAVLVATAAIGVAWQQRRTVQNRAEAAELVRQARTHLLSVDVTRRAWDTLMSGASQAAGTGQTRHPNMRLALTAYDRALALDPNEDLGFERDLLGFLVDAGPVRIPADVSVPDRIRISCPLTTRAVDGYRVGRRFRPSFDQLGQAVTHDRRALGMFAYLTGDGALCERSWEGIDPSTADAPLLDAALGIHQLADGRPEPAYQRLRDAWPHFDGVPFLALQLADAALSAGRDVDLAARWLKLAEPLREGGLIEEHEWRRVHADLLCSRGDRAAARQEYLRLSGIYSGSAKVQLRLAQLDLREGEAESAVTRLRELVRVRPGGARPRLWLARAALETRPPDHGTYLAQARYVLATDYGLGRSVGTQLDLLEILHLGGLQRLADEGERRADWSMPPWNRANPADFWASSGLFASREEVEALLMRLSLFDRDGRQAFSNPYPSGPGARLAETLSFLARAVTCFPEAVAMLGPRSFGVRLTAVLSGAGLAIRPGWPTVSTRLLPALLTALGLAGPASSQSPLHWSSYFGGSQDDAAYSVHVDGHGIVTVQGGTMSSNLPTTAGAFQQNSGGGVSVFDVFVARFDPSLTPAQQLLWCTYLGGSGGELAFEMHVDAAGRVTLAGYTDSPDFPVTANAYQSVRRGRTDAFVAQLSADGSQLLYSTLLGGSDDDRAAALSVDAQGVMTVGGYSRSANFPTTPGVAQPVIGGGQDAFVTRLDPSQRPSSQLLWSTFLGGSAREGQYYPLWPPPNLDYLDLCVHDDGSVTVLGPTRSSNFPTTPGCLQSTFAGIPLKRDAFVTRLDATGALLYSTFLGGNDWENPTAIAEHPRGGVYVAGGTWSGNYPLVPTPGAYQSAHGQPGVSFDGFLAWIDPAGNGASDLRYWTYFGGTRNDYFSDLAVEQSGVVTLCGYSDGSMPTTAGTFQTQWSSPLSGTVVRFDPQGRGARDLVYSSYLAAPGTQDQLFLALTLDRIGRVLLAGRTTSPTYPLHNAFQTGLNGGPGDGCVTWLDPLPAPVQRYGQPSPASYGPLYLSVNSQPFAGNTGFEIHVNEAPPNGFGWLFLGTPDVSGTTLAQLGITSWLMLSPAPISAAIAADAYGLARIPAPIPPNLTWSFGGLQTLWLDPTGGNPLVASDALQ